MRKIILFRTDFVTFKEGEKIVSEFDYVLDDLGIAEEDREKISAVTVEVMEFKTE